MADARALPARVRTLAAPRWEWPELLQYGVALVLALLVLASLLLLRGVPLELRSDPPGAEVRDERGLLGHTPLRRGLHCRDGRARLWVAKPGHVTWEWSGFCPSSGPLRIEARLLRY